MERSHTCVLTPQALRDSCMYFTNITHSEKHFKAAAYTRPHTLKVYLRVDVDSSDEGSGLVLIPPTGVL